MRKYFLCRPGPVDDYPAAYSPQSNDRFSRADAYQSPTAAADRASRSSVYQTPTGGYDQYNQATDARSSVEQVVPNQQKTPLQRKNFYGDIVEK